MVNGQRGNTRASADPISNSTLRETDGCVCADEMLLSFIAPCNLRADNMGNISVISKLINRKQARVTRDVGIS